ncbi:MAG: epoxyqueuosine reductase [Clostridiales bacterium]|nr:epoxyqueuosine reductase [Clostridiales bacterium]
MKEKITEIARSIGADKIGFSDVEAYVPTQYNDLTTAISFAVRMSDSIMDSVNEAPTHEYFHLYRSVNRLIDDIALRIVIELQRKGYRAIPIAASQSINLPQNMPYSALFSHRLAATRSGIGWIGKNASVITPEFGPRIRLGTVLTNLIVEYDEAYTESKCGNCNICVEKCPTLALSGVKWNPSVERGELVDVLACSNHMKDQYDLIGRGSVCGICISKCPIGKERL